MKLKRTIFALLAIATLAACGPKTQDLKLSNSALCLRDEATGEWLIGLFDNYAIYDCDYWNYAEKSDIHAVLTNGDQRKEVRLGNNAITIDGVKHKVSALTTKYLPDYPIKDETPFDGIWLDAEQDATLRVVHRSGKAGIGINTQIRQLAERENVSYEATSDTQGRYEAHIPLIGQTSSLINTYASQHIYHQGNWVWIPYIIAPGDKLLLYVDDIEGRIYAMGKTARMTNEFLNYPIYGYETDFYERMNMDLQTFLNTYDKGNALLSQHRDSILAGHKKLSKHYKDYTDGIMKSFFANELGQLRFNSGKVKRKDIIDEAGLHNLFNIQVPYLILERYDSFLDGICETAFDEYYNIGSALLQTVLQKAHNGQLNLSADDIRLIEREMPAVVANESPEANNDDLDGFYFTDALEKLFDSRPELTKEFLLYERQREIEALDTLLNLPPALREVAITRETLNNLTSNIYPLYDKDIQRLRQNVHHTYLTNEVLKTNDHLVSALKADGNTTADPRPLAELTDGEDIFNKIVEPYRGRHVYIDVWGTWCKPCRDMMELVPQLKEHLKDLDIVYLYLANNSKDDAWKNAIDQYHLAGKNCVHYNLPKTQQAALERYIGVGSYPTYKLVLPNGKLLPTKVPRPDHPGAIRYMIEETKLLMQKK